MTIPQSINNDGTIAGIYIDRRSYELGFVRYSSGKISAFAYPPRASIGTHVATINDSGMISGSYEACVPPRSQCEYNSGNREYGYLRTP